MRQLYPWEYTSKEGGWFSPWRRGPVTFRQLRLAVQRVNTVAVINGVYVHSLIFESAAMGHGRYARWDCVNGWTTTLAQARKCFPEGHHGKRCPIERMEDRYQ